MLISEPPKNPEKAREKTLELMFEVFEVPGLHLANKTMMCLYAYGRNGGINVDIGEDATYIEITMEGYQFPLTDNMLKIGGSNLT